MHWGIRPNAAQINLMKPALQRGRIGTKPEIISLRRNEQRISNERMIVMTIRPPLFERFVFKLHVAKIRSQPGIPINISIDDEPIVLPVAGQ